LASIFALGRITLLRLRLFSEKIPFETILARGDPERKELCGIKEQAAGIRAPVPNHTKSDKRNQGSNGRMQFGN